MKLNEFDQARLNANRELLILLACLIERYPELRFNQVLEVYNFIHKTNPAKNFYEEPQVTLKRVMQELEKYGIDI